MVLQRAVSTILCQQLKKYFLVSPPSPALAQEIRAAVTNLALRALGLAPTAHDKTTDVVIDVILTPIALGGGGLCDPVYRGAQECAVNLAAALIHPAATVRRSAHLLVAHARDRTRCPLTEHGDQTPQTKLDYIRHYAEVQLHKGTQSIIPPPNRQGVYNAPRRYRSQDFTPRMHDLLTLSKFVFTAAKHPVLSQMPVPRQQQPWTWSRIPAIPSAALHRAQTVVMSPHVLWMGVNTVGRSSFKSDGVVKPKGTAALSEEEAIRRTHEDDCFLHASMDRLTAMRYAWGDGTRGGGLVLMLDVDAIVKTYGQDAVRDVSTASGRASVNIQEPSP